MTHRARPTRDANRGVVCAALSALLGLCAGGCGHLVYFPSRALYSVPEADYESHAIPTADGLLLHAWLLEPREPPRRGTFIQFHGNAGNISSHYRHLEWVTERGYALLTVDYRGYGRSPGRPSAAGLRADALATISWAQTHAPRADHSSLDLVLFGQSLGGAVLLDAYPHAKSRARVRALVVEGTFHSYSALGGAVMWGHPVTFPFAGFGSALLSEAHSPGANIARVAPTPLLVLHDARDQVVPVGFGAAVYELARPPKKMWVTDTGAHVGLTADPELQEALLHFIEGAATWGASAPGG